MLSTTMETRPNISWKKLETKTGQKSVEKQKGKPIKKIKTAVWLITNKSTRPQKEVKQDSVGGGQGQR